jgi:lipoate-protein ligase A
MKWFFLNTGFNTGKFNMDFDLSLVRNCREDESYFRLYRWKPYCISIGANQSFDPVDIIKASNNNIDVVKRPTGGRAILHAEELTYSVVHPLSKISSLRNFYCEINKAIREGLILYDVNLSAVELESEQPDLRKFYRETSSEICFAVSARSEIKFAGKKLVGSAQRKINDAVLQHGSILCGNYHRKITEYLNLSNENLNMVNDKLSGSTIEMENILGFTTNYKKLEDSLAEGFERHFNITFENVNPEVFSLNEN